MRRCEELAAQCVRLGLDHMRVVMVVDVDVGVDWRHSRLSRRSRRSRNGEGSVSVRELEQSSCAVDDREECGRRGARP